MMIKTLPLGKREARPNSVKFKLANYANFIALPTPPAQFGDEKLIGKNSWGMLGNDEFGDCVFAGAAHETMLWNREAGKTVGFTEATVLSDYTALTGFNPNDPNTDVGADMQEAASYRRKQGIMDASGKRHKIAAYLAIEPGNIAEHLLAAYLFGAVGIGIRFPVSAMDQFNNGKPWDVVAHSPIDGGHYIPGVARRDGRFEVVTWGKLQVMTDAFFRKYNDESVAYVSEERLRKNRSPQGFNMAQLIADLNALK